MLDNCSEQELREMVEEYIVSLLSSVKEEKEESNKIETPGDISKHKYLLGKIKALELLETKVKSIKTDGNVYLTSAYKVAENIMKRRRPIDGSAASSPDAERGKKEVMLEVMTYIRSIKVEKE